MRLQKDILFSITRGKNRLPGLLIIFILLSSVSMANPVQQTARGDSIPPQLFTVAAIGEPADNTQYYEITFFQSARFYKLLRTNKNCDRILKLLRQSKDQNRAVQVILTEKFGDIIGDVRKAKK
jgi:hypothetical protein